MQGGKIKRTTTMIYIEIESLFKMETESQTISITLQTI